MAADLAAEYLAQHKPGAWVEVDEERSVHMQVVEVDNTSIEVFQCDLDGAATAVDPLKVGE